MLRSLKLVGVGPAPEMEMHFAPRLNVLTGDNGLGKSLFLETIWYVLTRNWVGMPAWPRRNADPAKIEFSIYTDEITRFLFQRPTQKWENGGGISYGDYIVLYARVDGSVAIHDPTRIDKRGPSSPEDLIFLPQEILNGQKDGERYICRGLIEDWVTWQERKSDTSSGMAFARLLSILEDLSPNPNALIPDETEVIRPGKPVRLFVNDPREFPTINVGYGDTPIIHASAAMLRIISLAYLMTWAWREHVEASRLLNRDPLKRIIFLMDEVENHLHPEWQRRILPALLKVLESLGEGMQVQMHVTTHSPMVLASLEPHWDEKRDELFHFALKDRKVVLESSELGRWGTASRWLKSRVFGLHADRSVEAERAMEDANAFMRGDEPQFFKTPEEVDVELKRTLPGQDPFWPRWLIFMGDAEK